MHDSVADQIVVLTMVEHWHVNHARILDRPPHEFVILNAMTVIRYRYNARLCKRTYRREFFPRQIFRNRARWKNIHPRDRGRAIFDPGNRPRIVRNRRGIWHANDSRESAGRGGSRTRFDGFLVTESRLAQMHVYVD